MRYPSSFVRSLTTEERQRVAAGLRSPDAFVVRRRQIVQASAHDAGVFEIQPEILFVDKEEKEREEDWEMMVDNPCHLHTVE